jgi:hypothetical protein
MDFFRASLQEQNRSLLFRYCAHEEDISTVAKRCANWYVVTKNLHKPGIPMLVPMIKRKMSFGSNVGA